MNKDNENESNESYYSNPDHFSAAEVRKNLYSDNPKYLPYEFSKHDFTKSYDKPGTFLEVNGEMWGSMGNLSVISGKAKSKKTYLVSAMIPALLNSGRILNCMIGTLQPGKNNVLFFDTEQSPYHVQQIVERSLKLGGIPKESAQANLKVFCLRPRSVEERTRIIEYGINHEEDIGVVIIDGLRDLLYDINSPEESSKLVSSLMKWSHVKNIHIISVLHQNKTDTNVRGHIGTEIINKCETHVEVSPHPMNRDVTIVDFIHTRNIAPNPFAFTIRYDGLPEEIDMPEANRRAARITEPEDVPIEEYQKAIESAFRNDKELNQSMLIKAFKQYFHVGENKIREYIGFCTDFHEILQMTKGAKRNEKIYKKY